MNSTAPSTFDHELAGSVKNCRALIASDVPTPGWVSNSRTCHLLHNHLIKHCGSVTVRDPFHIVRTNPSGSFFLACHKGQGQVMHEGSWKTVSEGQVCLLPAHTMNSLRVTPGKTWSFCWVRFHETSTRRPSITPDIPTFGSFASGTLQTAIKGLHEECCWRAPSHVDIHHWIELVNSHVSRFSSSQNLDPRILSIWKTAQQHLGYDWSLESLASISGMSCEHFRRLNQKQLHRSPIKHLIYLRMRKAAQLLIETDDKILTIAQEINYNTAYSFSNAFQHHFGIRPSVYRDSLSRT